MEKPFSLPLSLPTISFTREFSFGDADFDRIRVLIHKEAGIALHSTKKDMVYGRLVRRIRELKLTGFTDYVRLLEAPSGRNEFEQFVNALTTNLTFFFREGHHFSILAQYLQHKLERSGQKLESAIWCAAASTGEEPYSIAMTILEACPLVCPMGVKILATDLDSSVLDTGRRGQYPEEKITRLSPLLVKKYFVQRPEGMYQAKPILSNMIQFMHLNLVKPHWPLGTTFDAIFCRNVMIYFDRDTQLAILKRFVPLLNPGGLLFVGHSENLHFASHYFRLRGKTVYEVIH